MKHIFNRRTLLQAAAGSALAAPSVFSMIGSKSQAKAPEANIFEINGDWQVRVNKGVARVGKRHITIRENVSLDVSPPSTTHVRAERVAQLPPYDPNAAPWARGYRLDKLVTFETTAPDLLDTATLAVRLRATDADALAPKQDYDFDARWATIGIVPESHAKGRPVYIDYDCDYSRIDSIVFDSKGALTVLEGKPHPATPFPPTVASGDIAIANVWVPGKLAQLTRDNVYPIIEPEYPESARSRRPKAAELLPKTWARIQAKGRINILAWGDSVTDAGQTSDPAHRYQSVFAGMLREAYPDCRPALTTAAWGGRTSDNFLKEPAGSEHNFDSAVLGAKPDLIIMEFVNDAFMTPDVVDQRYSYLLKRISAIGAEWIILTRHYVRPDWMGEKSIRFDTDPRPYVAGVRQFCATHHVAIADASLRWGHLAKEGIPYTTLLANSINHPDDRGHRMFALSLMELFT